MIRKGIIFSVIAFVMAAVPALAEVPYIGKKEAKVEVIEYAPLNCAPCKRTHDALMLKLKKFIDEGKVKYQFKTLVMAEPTLPPAQILQCAKQDDYYKVFDALYATQLKWAPQEPPHKHDKDGKHLPAPAEKKPEVNIAELKAATAKYISAKDADKCLADKKQLAEIRKESGEAVRKYGLRAAPSFIINGERLIIATGEDSVVDAVKLALEGKSANKVVLEKTRQVMAISADDRVMGDPKAPVTIIEYASLSCPHCAKFHSDVLPVIKTKYIDTGKVKFVYRDFPLNAPALSAATLTRCVDSSKYYKLVATLFNNQKDWVAGKDEFLPKLKVFAATSGVSSKEFDTCVADKKIEEKVLLSYKNAADIGVQSTPSFFINGKPAEGMHDPKTASAKIDSFLK